MLAASKGHLEVCARLGELGADLGSTDRVSDN